jgi:predicted nucleic acid-binding protein
LVTAVDTNVLLDVFGADRIFGRNSADSLRRCLSEGALIACDAVWAETATAFTNPARFRAAAAELSMTFDPIDEETALKAADAWRRYCAQGGTRAPIASDFLIGAHAMTAADRLLTRDRGFYRRYFAGLRILDPSQSRSER